MSDPPSAPSRHMKKAHTLQKGVGFWPIFYIHIPNQIIPIRLLWAQWQ